MWSVMRGVTHPVAMSSYSRYWFLKFEGGPCTWCGSRASRSCKLHVLSFGCFDMCESTRHVTGTPLASARVAYEVMYLQPGCVICLGGLK